MKSIGRLFSFLVVFLYVALVQADQHPKYRVAAILSMTGDAAIWGNSTKQGIEIALSSLSPELRKEIEVVYEDDALQAKNAVTAFKRLKAVKPFNVLINVSSGTGNALAGLAEREKITFFSIASDQNIAAEREHVFMFYMTPRSETAAVLNEMERRKYRSIVDVVAIQEGYLAGQKDFYDQNNGRLKRLLSEQFPPDVRDFRSFVTKIGQLNPQPDAIFVLLLPGQVGIFAKQVREAGINVPLVGGINFESEEEVKSSNGALLGQWYVTNGDPAPDFLQRYKAANPAAPLATATNGHDAIAILAQALKEGVKAEDLPTYLRSIKSFHGASGELSYSDGGSFMFPTAIREVIQ